MKTEDALKHKIESALSPVVLKIENESHKHSSGLGAESHFKVLVVSDAFKGVSRIERQRVVFDLLAQEMKTIHALSLRLLTLEENSKSSDFVTPNCQSKNK